MTQISQRVKRQRKSFAPIQAQTQRVISRIADSDCPVLIAGEDGVGKRSIAEQIHVQSHRSRGIYVELDCGDVQAETIQSALSANGTIYLAEIGDMSLALQELIIDTYLDAGPAQCSRLLFGTSRDLRNEVKSWRMREDFYYLISAVTLHVSPLRCRKSEILSMVDDLLTQYSNQFERPKPILRKEIIQFLLEHKWPDNLPELHTAIRTFVAIEDQSVSLAALKAKATTAMSNGHPRPQLLKEATRAAATQIEQRLICEVLSSTSGNRKRAAAELGISYKALLYKLKHIEVGNQHASHEIGVAI
jgi:DNA-binding NtrC family response regulator